MMKSINISTKVTLLIMAVSLAAIAAISFFSFDYHQKNTRDKYAATLGVIADNRAAYFNTFFERATTAIQVLQNADALKSGGSAASAAGDADLMATMGPPPEAAAGDTVLTSASTDQVLAAALTKQKYLLGVEDITVTSPTGAIAASTDPTASGNFIDPDGVTFDRAKNGICFSSVLRDKKTKTYFTYAVGAIKEGDAVKQLVIVKLNLSTPYKVLKNYQGLGVSGEVLLARQDPLSRKIALISPFKNDTTAAILLRDPTDKAVASFEPLFDDKAVASEGVDYRGRRTLQTGRKIGNTNIALIAKIDADEAYGDVSEIMGTFVYAGICILALATLLSMMFTRSITRPLYAMKSTLGLVAQGVLPEPSDDKTKDEFGEMGVKVDELVLSLKNNANFAQRIGEGKYDTAFRPASDNDILGMSLINMRNNLIENERRDKERNWIVRGVAEIS
jgi:hypothetical protein